MEGIFKSVLLCLALSYASAAIDLSTVDCKGASGYLPLTLNNQADSTCVFVVCDKDNINPDQRKRVDGCPEGYVTAPHVRFAPGQPAPVAPYWPNNCNNAWKSNGGVELCTQIARIGDLCVVAETSADDCEPTFNELKGITPPGQGDEAPTRIHHIYGDPHTRTCKVDGTFCVDLPLRVVDGHEWFTILNETVVQKFEFEGRIEKISALPTAKATLLREVKFNFGGLLFVPNCIVHVHNVDGNGELHYTDSTGGCPEVSVTVDASGKCMKITLTKNGAVVLAVFIRGINGRANVKIIDSLQPDGGLVPVKGGILGELNERLGTVIANVLVLVNNFDTSAVESKTGDHFFDCQQEENLTQYRIKKEEVIDFARHAVV